MPTHPSTCNKVCSGNKTQICGGSWRMNIYQAAEKPKIEELFETATKSWIRDFFVKCEYINIKHKKLSTETPTTETPTTPQTTTPQQHAILVLSTSSPKNEPFIVSFDGKKKQ